MKILFNDEVRGWPPVLLSKRFNNIYYKHKKIKKKIKRERKIKHFLSDSNYPTTQPIQSLLKLFRPYIPALGRVTTF